MSRLHGCFSNLIRTVCSFMNRHHVLDDAGDSIASLKSKGCTKECSSAGASKLYYIRRAALALFVALATILATFVFSPIEQTRALQEKNTAVSSVKDPDSTNKSNQNNSDSKGVDTKNTVTKTADDNSLKIDGSKTSNANSVTKTTAANDAKNVKQEKPNNAAAAKKTDSSSNQPSLASQYNPQYAFEKYYPQYISISAGWSEEVSPALQSVKPENDKNNKVKSGSLPAGTWFEIKDIEKLNGSSYVKNNADWAHFEGSQCENNSDCLTTKPMPEGNSDFGKITVRPSSWDNPGEYRIRVIVHYSDRSTSENKDSGNGGKPLYLNVFVRGLVGEPTMRLNIHENATTFSDGSISGFNYYDDSKGINFAAKEKLSKDLIKYPSFDSAVENVRGKITQRVLCYKKDSKGNPVDNSYTSGGIPGLKLVQEAFKHPSYEQQKKCRESSWRGTRNHDNNVCQPDKYLHDIYINQYIGGVYGGNDYVDRTFSHFEGTVGKPGDYSCTVYAIRNDVTEDGKEDSSRLNSFDSIASKNGNNLVKVNAALAKNNSFTQGNNYISKQIDIHVHGMSHFYNPYYDEMDYLKAVVNDTWSFVPKNLSADGTNPPLPDGTWFELKPYPGVTPVDADTKSVNIVPKWAHFESGQSNEPKDKKDGPGKDSKPGSGSKYGIVSTKLGYWLKVPDEGKTFDIPVIVHYPDGSSSLDKDSLTKGEPVYIRAKVNPAPYYRYDGDLKLRVRPYSLDKRDSYKYGSHVLNWDEYDPETHTWKYGATHALLGEYDVIDPKQGATLMLGSSFKDSNSAPFLDAWSEDDIKAKISLKLLCREDNSATDKNSKWKSSIDGIAKGDDTQWSYVSSLKDFNDCKKSDATCTAKHKLYRRDALEGSINEGDSLASLARTDSFIGGTPQKTGDYQCVVYALKQNVAESTAWKAYENSFANGVQNGDSLLEGANAAKFASFKQGIDWEKSVFPLHVVKLTRLPKTGGCGWNAYLCIVSALLCSLVAAWFVMDQTKRGHELLGRWRLV